MLAERQGPPVSDDRRDARRYHGLLLALQSATSEIREMEERGRPDLGEVMRRLLPAFCESLEAAGGFVAVQRSAGAPAGLEVTATYPETSLRGSLLPWSGVLQRLREDGKPKVVDSLGEGPARPVPGLEMFGASAAVLVCARRAAETWVVGVCDHRDPLADPYLALDGKALQSMVELVTIGARVGEQHRQQLRSLQETSQAVSGVLKLDDLLAMVTRQTAEVFNAAATSVMLWDETRAHLVIRASWGLAEDYARRLRIPAAALRAEIERAGAEGPQVTHDLRVKPYGQLDLILKERLVTVLSAQLRVEGEIIGLLNIYSKEEPRDFTATEIELTAVYANQVAIAVKNAGLYEAARRETQHWQALHAAGKAILAGFSTEQQSVLDCIVAQAVERITSADGASPTAGILQLYDEERNELRFVSIYPAALRQVLTTRIGTARSIDARRAPDGRIGITGRAVRERQPVRVPDVRLDPDYVCADAGTRSELAVPLLDGEKDHGDAKAQRRLRLAVPLPDGEKVIGVLSVESSRLAAFDESDQSVLAGLADLAVIAIRNAAQADRLSVANAVAMVGAWGAAMAHAVNREVGFIRLATYALEQSRGLSPEARGLLRDVDRHAGNLSMLELPRQGARAGEALEIREAAFADKVVQAEVDSFARDYPGITWECEPGCPGLQVAMHEQWLRRLLHLLMHNAAEAIKPDKEARRVVLRTAVRGEMIEVQVEDSGPGVAPAVQPLLFHQPIPAAGKNRGQGLLLARFVAEQHGGTVELRWSRPGEGACFAFSIPAVRRRPGAGRP